MAEKVVILQPGDEQAQKVAKAIASPTAGEILRMLAETPMSLTAITETLTLPLTTTKYHIENLLDAGLIVVSGTKYSVKGREVKMYSLTDQLVIVAS
jgi:DNA-binding transcriptional ArsR family regulator